MNPKLKALLASRKFWAAAVGLVVTVTKAFQPDFPMDESQVTNVVYLLVAYILGTAISNVNSVFAETTTTTPK